MHRKCRKRFVHQRKDLLYNIFSREVIRQFFLNITHIFCPNDSLFCPVTVCFILLILSFQTNGKPQRHSFFAKIPARLCFRLSDLIDISTLRDGYYIKNLQVSVISVRFRRSNDVRLLFRHVFMGFTIQGYFLLSYVQPLEISTVIKFGRIALRGAAVGVYWQHRID